MDVEEYRRLLLDELFDERPVDLLTFIEHKDFLHTSHLSEIQFNAVKNSTQIYFPDLVERAGLELVKHYTETVLLWGKGSGKDFVSGVMIARIVYLLDCLTNPQLYLGKAEVSAIDTINMAFSSQQAQANFFEPFSALVTEADCFDGRVRKKRDFLTIPDKRIRAFSGHSFGGAVEGKNLIAGVLDEIAEFKTQKEMELLGRRSVRAPKYSAEALYDVIRSSVDSRFPTGKVILLSYPRYKGDYIMTKYDQAVKDPNAYASKGASWVVNPSISKESLEIDRRRNPERWEGKYNVNPSASEDAFFKNQDAITKCFPEITEEQSSIYDDLAPRFKNWYRCNHHFLCSMHVDLSKSKCRAGIAMVHQSGIFRNPVYSNDIGGYMEEELPLVTVDFITSFEAAMGGEIDFEKVREFIKDVRKRGFKVGVISFDGYQSVDMTQHLTKAGFHVIYRSVDKTTKAYDDLKTMIYEGRLQGGSVMPRTLVIDGQKKSICVITEELQMLVDFKGKKILHIASGSKDEADALAGAVQGALELGLWTTGDIVSAAKDEKKIWEGRFDPQRDNIFIPGFEQENNTKSVPKNLTYRGIPS